MRLLPRHSIEAGAWRLGRVKALESIAPGAEASDRDDGEVSRRRLGSAALGFQALQCELVLALKLRFRHLPSINTARELLTVF